MFNMAIKQDIITLTNGSTPVGHTFVVDNVVNRAQNFQKSTGQLTHPLAPSLICRIGRHIAKCSASLNGGTIKLARHVLTKKVGRAFSVIAVTTRCIVCFLPPPPTTTIRRNALSIYNRAV